MVHHDELQMREMADSELEKIIFDEMALCQRYDYSMPEQTKINLLKQGLSRYLLEKVYASQRTTTTELIKQLKLFAEGPHLAARQAATMAVFASPTLAALPDCSLQRKDNFQMSRAHGRGRVYNRRGRDR